MASFSRGSHVCGGLSCLLGRRGSSPTYQVLSRSRAERVVCRGFSTVVVVDGDRGRAGHQHPHALGGSRSIVEGSFLDGAFSRSQRQPRANERQPTGSIRYPIPQAYVDVLPDRQGDVDNSSEGGDQPALEPAGSLGSEDKTKGFWRATRSVARERLKSGGPDAAEWERRVAQLHESLWVEELGVMLELRKCQLTLDMIPHIRDSLYSLDTSALREDQMGPRGEDGVLRGVRILIRCSAGNVYWAAVQPGSVVGNLLVSASENLARSEGPYMVEFHPQRFQQVAMHRALDAPMSEGMLRTAIPAETSESGAPAGPATDDVVESLPASLNEGQRRAVASALQVGALYPLVVWGPPGTGKSTLGAFIVWHLVQQRPTNLHILVAAPSNTAADVLCSKLARLGLDKDQMLRLNALGRSWGTVPEDIQQYSYYNLGNDGRPVFAVPPLPRLRRYKVVVTTCICAAHISNALRDEGASTKGGWFSHVVVDEAGEATEPETLVPLALLRAVAGRAVLLGDHFQLGPLVTSPLARELSRLDASMLERLANERFVAARDADEAQSGINRDVLRDCEARGLFFLTESYRSHPDIMAVYSKLFYSDQLEHCRRQQHLSLMSFFEARGLGGPLLLHHVVGEERRDPGSPSVYNSEEVRLVARYVTELLEDESLGLAAQDVGIITPYTRQVRALERHLASLGPSYAGVEVGTVEHFQGQERRAILLSTVRSSLSTAAGASAAVRRPIGFLADKKRLNVAVSRAVAGLIIVGDLRMLSRHSQEWRALVSLGQERGALRGEPLDGPYAGQGLGRASQAPQRVPAAEASAAWESLTAEVERR